MALTFEKTVRQAVVSAVVFSESTIFKVRFGIWNKAPAL